MRCADDAQVSAPPSDRGSDEIEPETALADLVESWGLGGALVELQHLAARHGALPTEAAELLAPLSMLVCAYAPTGSIREPLAWRSTSCPLCDEAADRG